MSPERVIRSRVNQAVTRVGVAVRQAPCRKGRDACRAVGTASPSHKVVVLKCSALAHSVSIGQTFGEPAILFL